MHSVCTTVQDACYSSSQSSGCHGKPAGAVRSTRLFRGGGPSRGRPATGSIQDTSFTVGPGDNITAGYNGSYVAMSDAACEVAGGPTTLSTGATTTDTGVSCLPANAVIDAVAYRITTTITTAANFTVGDASTAARFCTTQSTLTAGTTGVCFVQAGTSSEQQTTSAKVRITTNANPGAGAIRLIVYYHLFVAPTS